MRIVSDQVEHQVRWKVWNQVRRQVDNQIVWQVLNQVWDQVEDNIANGEQLWN